MRRSLRLHARILLVLLPALLAACATTRPPSSGAQPSTTKGRTTVLLSINDVYRIEGVEEGTLGGLARLRTLRQQLEQKDPDLLVVHAGDMLFPSLLSRTFNGAQMIDVLSLLDGSPGFDSRMFAVFGNHEFDKTKMSDATMVSQRVRDSQFRWLNSNVVFATGTDGRPLVAGDNLVPSTIVESGGIRIGLFGLTTDIQDPDYVTSFKDPIATAREMTADLRKRGAEAVVAITHLEILEDRRILAALGDAGPDLILGGHDHEAMACEVGGHKVFKADADARTATVARITLGPDGKLAVERELVPIGSKLAEDCAVDGTVQSWLALHEGLFCGQEAGKNGTPLDPSCLETKLGSTRTLLEAEESKIRSSETSFGDWIADQMVAAFASCGAQAAFINSGTLRLNQDLAAGSEILRQHVEELIGFTTKLSLLRLKGKTLKEVTARSIEGWPGSGNWLQISGFSFTHDTQNQKASDLQLVTSAGSRPVQDDDDILVVTNQFLFDPSQGNQDKYTMLDPSLVLQDCAANGKDLKVEIITPVLQAATKGIAPKKDGRIRQVPEGAESDPCSVPLQ